MQTDLTKDAAGSPRFRVKRAVSDGGDLWSIQDVRRRLVVAFDVSRGRAQALARVLEQSEGDEVGTWR